MCLMNSKNLKQKVAVGVVSGFRGIDKFHFNTILESWLKVDMKEVMSSNADLMYPNKVATQHVGRTSLVVILCGMKSSLGGLSR